jgi:hypothetical protein
MDVKIHEHFTSVFGRNLFNPKMETGCLSEILAFMYQTTLHYISQ